MKLKVIISTILFIFGFLISAFAQTSVKAEVDKTRITSDETITYKLIITSSEKNLPTPQVPKFAGFVVISQAQSSTVSLAEGNIKTILVYVFILSPTDAGKMKIEPSSIKIKDDTYSTAAFEIEIRPDKRKLPLRKPERKPSLPQESPTAPEEQQPKITL